MIVCILLYISIHIYCVKFSIFCLHISQKFTTFALDLKQHGIATFAIKLKNLLIMKMNVFSWKQQAQDYVLRLFVEPLRIGSSTPSTSYYTCAHCGTFVRIRQ